jgi:hypothetical protein
VKIEFSKETKYLGVVLDSKLRWNSHTNTSLSYISRSLGRIGHLKIYEDFHEVMDQHALSDKMPIRHDFEAPFEVKIYEREGWNHVPTEQSILTYYTDGSRKDGMTGIGIYGLSVRYYEALGESTTIFQAEINAMNVCARICLSTEGLYIYNVRQPSCA